MTRKKQLVVVAAAAVVGAAVIAYVWQSGDAPPVDGPAPEAHTTPSHSASQGASTEGTPDPNVKAQIRQAYEQSLAEKAPPGMNDLMHPPAGTQPGAGDLPPVPDPFVVPAGHHSGSGPSAELPPLPPDLGAKSKPLPPPVKSPGADKTPKEGPASDLPPLPPPPKSR